MTPDDRPNEYTNLYFVPQRCGHVLEFRCAAPCVPGDFAPLLGEKCHWCSAAEMQMDDVPPEFKSKWRGGTLIRKCPFNLVELRELGVTEAEVMRDGPDPAPQ